MLKQIFLIIIVILLNHVPSFSQNKYEYYFDNDMNLVKKSEAVFNGIGVYNNGVFELKIYYRKSDKLLILQDFTDSSLAISNGSFFSYFPDQKKEWEGNYLQGKQNGLWRKWNMDGKITDSSLFDDGEKIMQANFVYNFPDSGMTVLNIDSLKTGKVTEIQFDSRGKIVSSNNFKLSEDPDKVFTKVEVDAQFPGGPKAWEDYVAKAMLQHMNEFTDKDYGTCVIRFIVDKTGKVSNVEVASMKGRSTKLAQIAVNIIKNGPNWLPAKQNGRVVNAYRLQPVTLQRQIIYNSSTK